MGVNLSRSAWHYRLQKYAFGVEPDTFNLCPYFWATVFSLFFLPTALLGNMLAPYMDTHHEDGRGRRYDGTRSASNLEVGGWSTLMVLLTLLGISLVGIIGYAMLLLFTTPGGALGFLVVAGGLALLFGTFKAMDLWVPYLLAVKDSICPIITWRE